MKYEDYIRSKQWKAKADETKRLAGYRCQVCNSDEELNAHHRTYERLGEELQSDLVCLCAKCHSLFHNGGRVIENAINTEALFMLAEQVSEIHHSHVKLIASLERAGNFEERNRLEHFLPLGCIIERWNTFIKTRLTKRAPDAGDSAAFLVESTPEVLSAYQELSTPTPRR